MITTYLLIVACTTWALGGVSLLLRVWHATELNREAVDPDPPDDRVRVLFAFLITLFMTIGTKKRSVWMEIVLLCIGTVAGAAFLVMTSHA